MARIHPLRRAQLASIRRQRFVRGLLAPVLCGLCLWTAGRSGPDPERKAFESQAAALTDSLSDRLESRAQALAFVATLFSDGETPGWRGFGAPVASGIVERAPGELFAWAPFVPGDDRLEFEQQSGRSAQRSFSIRDLSEDNKLGRSPGRPTHLPLQLLDPTRGNDGFLGLDLAAFAAAEILLPATEDPRIRVVGPLLMPSRGSLARVLILARPVFEGERPRGYLLATVPYADLAASVFEPGQRIGAGSQNHWSRIALDLGSIMDSRPPPPAPVELRARTLTWHGLLQVNGAFVTLRIEGLLGAQDRPRLSSARRF